MTIGEKILKLRKARGWSQEELAGQLNVTRQAVSRWESNASKPEADKIVELCDLFGVSADYLLRSNYVGEATQNRNEATDSRASGSLGTWQILGLVMMIMGFVTFLGMCWMSTQGPQNYYINGHGYGVLAGYIIFNDLWWLVCLEIFTVLAGAGLLVKLSLFDLIRLVGKHLGITALLKSIWESDMLHDLRVMFGPNE